jgi:hypothetical protein
VTHRKNILFILESLGYVFPMEKESIIEFEKKYTKDISQIVPKDWDNPLNILNRGIIEEISIENNYNNSSISGLAQAARNGKPIPIDIKKKMQEDRDNAENEK